MARRRNPPEMVRAKWQLAERLRAVRTELFGERGLADFARSMGVPVRTWYSYETGVTVPSEVLLRFIELTSVDTGWLLNGRGEQFLPSARSEARRLPIWELDAPHAEGEDAGAWEEAESGERPAFRTAACVAELPDEDAKSLEPEESGLPNVEAMLPTTLDGVLVARGYRCLRIIDDAMLPLAAEGAIVAYSAVPEPAAALEGKLVVARLEANARPILRWIFPSGQFALLRAENPAYAPATHLINLRDESVDRQVRRVLWVGSPH